MKKAIPITCLAEPIVRKFFACKKSLHLKLLIISTIDNGYHGRMNNTTSKEVSGKSLSKTVGDFPIIKVLFTHNRWGFYGQVHATNSPRDGVCVELCLAILRRHWDWAARDTVGNFLIGRLFLSIGSTRISTEMEIAQGGRPRPWKGHPNHRRIFCVNH
jgi:hypothetical protein